MCIPRNFVSSRLISLLGNLINGHLLHSLNTPSESSPFLLASLFSFHRFPLLHPSRAFYKHLLLLLMFVDLACTRQKKLSEHHVILVFVDRNSTLKFCKFARALMRCVHSREKSLSSLADRLILSEQRGKQERYAIYMRMSDTR